MSINAINPTWPLQRLRIFQPAPSRSRRTSTHHASGLPSEVADFVQL